MELTRYFTIGADPEFFLKKRGVPFPAPLAEACNGTKENPSKLDKGAWQVDGLALEFNIEPSVDSTQFDENIKTVIGQMRNLVDKKLSFAFEPSIVFDEAIYQKLDDKAKELGCDPDFDAYNNNLPNPRPDNSTLMRTAAGHIHIGWCNGADPTHPEHLEICNLIVKAMDIYLGVPSILLDQKGKQRREMYGKAGAFRPKSYGVEYRTLSNFWVTTKYLRYWAFRQANHALMMCRHNPNAILAWSDLAKQIINTGDESEAKDFCKYKIGYHKAFTRKTRPEYVNGVLLNRDVAHMILPRVG